MDESEFVMRHAGRKIVGDTSELTEVSLTDDELWIHRRSDPPLEVIHLAEGESATVGRLVAFL